MTTTTIPFTGDTIPCDNCLVEDPFHAEWCSEIYEAPTVRSIKATPNRTCWCLWCGREAADDFCSQVCAENSARDGMYVDADVVFAYRAVGVKR
jgi:hypothetical protein